MHAHSAPWDLDWESYRASVDVLQQKNIFALPPDSAPYSKEAHLPRICVAPGALQLPTWQMPSQPLHTGTFDTPVVKAQAPPTRCPPTSRSGRRTALL